MKLTSLTIERSPSYGDRPNQLVGSLKLDSDQSSHTITLTAVELNQIIEVIKNQVAKRALHHVKQLPAAFVEAQAETLLLEFSGSLGELP